jgi:hypothetical protein
VFSSGPTVLEYLRGVAAQYPVDFAYGYLDGTEPHLFRVSRNEAVEVKTLNTISNMASALPAPEPADKDLQSLCRLKLESFPLIRYRPRYPVCVWTAAWRGHSKSIDSRVASWTQAEQRLRRTSCSIAL